MDPVKSAFLELLAAFVHQRVPHLDEMPDWPAIVRLARNHAVEGIVAVTAAKLPTDRRPPTPLYETLHHTMHLEAACSIRQELDLLHLMQHMEREGIDHLLMKGIVVRDYYPIPELRTFSDIDILVRPEDTSKIDTLMRSLGYAKAKGTPYVSVFGRRGIADYEIHTNILPDMPLEQVQYCSYVSGAWENARLAQNKACYQFTPEYHMLYLLLHLAKHFAAAGAGIRMFLDIAVSVRNGPPVDWSRLLTMARETESDVFCLHVLDLCERWFGIAVPHPLSHRMSASQYEDICDYVLDAGSHGSHTRRPLVPVCNALRERPDNISAAQRKAVAAFLMPPCIAMTRKYPWLQGRAWLLPLAWVRRGIAGLAKKPLSPTIGRIKRTLAHGHEAHAHYRRLQDMGLGTRKQTKSLK